MREARDHGARRMAQAALERIAAASGVPGPTGPAGPKGDTGATGAAGPAGANGADGVTIGFGAPLKISGMTFALNQVSNTSTLAGAADRHQLIPWTPAKDITITAIGVECQTAVAGSAAKVVIYDQSSSTYGPNNLLKETGSLDCSTTGYKSEAWAYTFQRGVTYWVGVRTSGTATLRATLSPGMANIGRQAATSTGSANVIQKTLAFATPASNPYGAVGLGQLQTQQTVYDVIATQA